jgi:hypothetical protein
MLTLGETIANTSSGTIALGEWQRNRNFESASATCHPSAANASKEYR